MMFQESFCMFKAIDTMSFFFKCLFSLSDVHHSFSKLKKILTLMTIKEKQIEIGKIHLKTCTFEQICFKCAFDLKNYEI